MEKLGKRPPWRPSTALPSASRGPFSTVSNHTPLNEQQWSSRHRQLGLKRTVEMKKRTKKELDSREDIALRDRANMFGHEGRNGEWKGPIRLKSARRHERTPYDYDTQWISHPGRNTSLAPRPEEQWKTTFLGTPRKDEDQQRKANDWERRMATIHHFDKTVGDYYLKVAEDVKIADARLLHNYQAQRSNHNSALDIRRRVERVRYFD
jgi:hypothetical protein